MRSRTKILNATLDLIRGGGFEAVSIAAVAQRAGVSRQTVYSIFGSREDLVSQTLSDLASRALAGMRARLDAAETVPEFIVEAIVASRAVVRADPVLVTLSNAGQGNPVHDANVVARAKPIARQLLSPLLKIDPDIEPQLDDIAQLVIRLGLSVILFDDEEIHEDDDLRRFLTRWIAPGLRIAH